MSLRYLPEYAQIVIFSLELARKEAEHLRYSESKLFKFSLLFSEKLKSSTKFPHEVMA